MPMLRRSLLAVLAMIALSSFALRAQQADPPAESFVKAHYTKYEYRIPMRDGKRLFTAVYVPKASAFPADPGPYPSHDGPHSL